MPRLILKLGFIYIIIIIIFEPPPFPHYLVLQHKNEQALDVSLDLLLLLRHFFENPVERQVFLCGVSRPPVDDRDSLDDRVGCRPVFLEEPRHALDVAVDVAHGPHHCARPFFERPTLLLRMPIITIIAAVVIVIVVIIIMAADEAVIIIMTAHHAVIIIVAVTIIIIGTMRRK